MVAVAKDETLSKEDRIKAIEKLNALSPEYLGNLTLENISTEEGARLLNAYVTALDKKALAQAVSNKKQELFAKLLDQENSSLEENIGWTDKAAAVLLNYGNTNALAIELAKKGVKNQDAKTKSIEAEIKAFDELTKKMIAAGKIDVGDLLGGADDDGGKKEKDNGAAAARATAQHKLKVAQLQEEIRLQRDIANDEFATLAERIKAQAAFNDAKIELLKVNRDFELSTIARTSKSCEEVCR